MSDLRQLIQALMGAGRFAQPQMAHQEGAGRFANPALLPWHSAHATETLDGVQSMRPSGWQPGQRQSGNVIDQRQAPPMEFPMEGKIGGLLPQQMYRQWAQRHTQGPQPAPSIIPLPPWPEEEELQQMNNRLEPAR